MSSWYPTSTHPFLGNFVQRQAELLGRKHAVTILKLEVCMDASATIECEENGSIRIITARYSQKGSFIRRFISKNRAFKKALQEIPSVDLIHAHVCFPNGLFFTKAKRFFNCPLIVTEHASYYDPEAHWNRKMKLIIPRTIRRADQVIAVSDFLKADIQKRFPGTNVHVIPNHIDTQLFVPAETEPALPFHFLHISTLASVKRVSPILEAIETLHREGLDIRMTIVSDEDYSTHLSAVQEKGLQEVIHFAGPVKWEETIPYYKRAHCFVLNSSYETFSIVLAEAMSCGLPLISTKVGLAAQLPETYGLFLHRNHSQTALEDALRTMAKNHGVYSRQEIRNFALRYDSETILGQLTHLYEQTRLHHPPEPTVDQ